MSNDYSNKGVNFQTNPLYVSPSDTKATSKVEVLEKAQNFTLDNSKITTGGGEKAPKSKFAEIWSGIKELFSIAFDKIAKFFSDTPVVGAPKGLQVGVEGYIDFKAPMKLHDTALMQVDMSDKPQKTTPMDFMTAQANKHSETDRTVDIGNGQTLALNSEICRDLGRVHVEIPTDNGVYDSNENGTPAESKLSETARNLKEFAGSDEGAQIISSFTNQYTIRNLIRVMDGGDSISIARMVGSKDTFDVDMPDGETLHRTSAPQVGDAQFKLSKTEDGDFKIDIEWPTYIKGFDGQGSDKKMVDGEIKLPFGKALKQDVTISFVLSRDSASNGEIKVLGKPTAEIHIQGRVPEKEVK